MNWWVKSTKRFVQLLNYIEYFLILATTITGSVFIVAFAPLIGIPIGIASSEIGLNICAITAGIKKDKSIIKKKEKKHDKIVWLAKSKWNTIEVLISKSLIDSNISHNKFVSINNVLKEYEKMKEEIKNLKILSVYQRL